MGPGRTIQVITTTTVVFASLLPSATADACGLMDWLFGRQETVAMMPVAGPTACNSCAPQTVACSPPVQTCMRVVPQTTYSTVWARKPVTTYRPVSSVDPCTGCQVTCMKPCTSYKYELQRVPYTTYRTEYVQSPVQGGSCCGNAYSTAESYLPNMGTMLGGPATQYASSGCSSCSAGTMPAGVAIPQTTYPTTLPGPQYPQTYYPEGQYPAGQYPAGTIPGAGQPQPAMTVPSNGGYIPNGAAADRAPSLLQQRPSMSPSQMQPLNPTPAQTQPGSSAGISPSYPQNYSQNSPPSYPQNYTQYGATSPAPASPSTTGNSTGNSSGNSSGALYGNDTLLDPPGLTTPSTGTGSGSKSSVVTPLPDPDRPQIQRITPALHPEDRSANRNNGNRSNAWQVKLISWPEPTHRPAYPEAQAPQFPPARSNATIPTLQPQAAPPTRQQPVWDDGGWQNAR